MMVELFGYVSVIVGILKKHQPMIYYRKKYSLVDVCVHQANK